MYVVKVVVDKSTIEGKGVFASEYIKKGTVVWKFDENHDLCMSVDEYDAKSQADKNNLDRIAYLSYTSNRYVYPPKNDPALYTNHDAVHYNLLVWLDLSQSPEPFFVARQHIEKGEELLNNYHQFDEAIEKHSINSEWLW